jgi:2-keto-4-pentenoate hydratase
MTLSELEEKANWFIGARQAGRYNQTLPAKFCPSSLSQAYALQNRLIDRIGPVDAWKLGGATAATRQIFNTQDVYYGPVFAGRVLQAPFMVAESLLGGPKGEAEIAFRLSAAVEGDVLPKDPWELADLVAPSIELPTSTVENLPRHGLNALIADGCAYGALVLGDALPLNAAVKGSINTLPISIAYSGVVERGSTEQILTSPIGALAAFVKAALANGAKLRAGQWVATGGCTSCIPLPVDQKIELDFGALGAFSFKVSSR